jgi:erythromycin esterase-like protein
MTTQTLAETLGAVAHPLTGATDDYDALLQLIGEARFVLIGEASHGTHEFYHARAAITKRLIAEKGFTAVAVEADWPDAYRVNCYARGASDDASAERSLAGFKRFPTWMWRNTDVLEFVEWLHDRNVALPAGASKAGFYGLDLYSLYGSIDAVLGYLREVDPAAFERARARYACFDHFHEDTQAYGYAATLGLSPSCEEAVLSQLLELQRHAAEYSQRDSGVAEDQYFYAEQNARLVKSAEEYYRSMFGGRAASWNLRDTHMADTLDALATHLSRHGAIPKIVLWAHNSHLGDARATEMSNQGELNVGQLMRERHAGHTFSVGFSTYSGTVTAASDWDKPAERKRVRPALDGSYEQLFHETKVSDFLLDLHAPNEAMRELQSPRLQRAIGVIYRPETERWSHYFHASLPRQFDALVHFDQSSAVEPLERTAGWERGEGEAPETYPTGV